MFPGPYFGWRYFPPAYFPKSGAAAVPGFVVEAYAVGPRRETFSMRTRGSQFDVGPRDAAFVPAARGSSFVLPWRDAVFVAEDQ